MQNLGFHRGNKPIPRLGVGRSIAVLLGREDNEAENLANGAVSTSFHAWSDAQMTDVSDFCVENKVFLPFRARLLFVFSLAI